MRIVFGNHRLEMKTWASQREMIDYVSSCEEGYVLLGENASQYRQFYSAEIRLGFTGITSFGIGLYSEGHGLVPHLLLLPDKEGLLFGFNNEVAGVWVDKKYVGFRILLDSLFRSFIHLREPRIVLIFHEIGVTTIDETGNQKWSFTRDILESCHLSKTTLELQFLDEPPVKLALETGEQLPNGEIRTGP